MEADTKIEAAVRSCYSTWSSSYYEDYYGPNAAYPPVHRSLITSLLRDAGVRRLLDAGCGPASFLRELAGQDMELYGFDVTSEMVTEARKVLGALGVPPDHVWEGSVLSAESFQPPACEAEVAFDAAICVGVLPHVADEADIRVIENLHNAVRTDGLVIIEARNQLFSLFTLNRYSCEFFLKELVQRDSLLEKLGDEAPGLGQALSDFENHFRMDLPPVRKGKEGEPGYDEVLSLTHNPLVLREQFASAGFCDVQLLFYHYHCLPPMFEKAMPELFRRESLALENPYDWRGHFMASAFLVAGRRT